MNAALFFAGILASCASFVKFTPTPFLAPHVTARELVEIRELSGLAVSPDARLAAVRVEQGSVADNTVALSWHMLDLATGEVRRIADAGQPRLNRNGGVQFEAPQWSPDGEWIYYRAIADQQSQVWRARVDGGVVEQVSRDLADVITFDIASSGTIRYMAAGATRAEIRAAEAAEFDNGVLLDSTIIQGYRITENFPVNGRAASQRQNFPGSGGLEGTLLADRPPRIMILDIASRQATPATSAASDEMMQAWQASLAGLSLPTKPFERRNGRDGRIAEVSGPAPGAPPTTSQQKTMLSWSEGERIHHCTHPACENVDEIAIVGWLASEVVFQARTFDQITLNVWDTAASNVRTVARGSAMFGSIDSGTRGVCQIAGDKAVCIKAGPDLPPRLVSVDLADGEEVILFDPNPTLTPERLGVAKQFVVHDSFGNATVVRAILPRDRTDAHPLPLVITNYTCPGFLLGGSGRDVAEHVLAGMGFAAACVDTGSDVRRQPDFAMTQANVNRSSMEFFEAAVRELADQGMVDRDRVGLTGFSGGATAALYSLSKSPVFSVGIVTTATALDVSACYLVAYLGRCQRLAAAEGFPPPYDRKDGMLADSPAWHPERISAPLLMQLSEVEYESNLQLWAALTDSGRAAEMYVFPDAYHYKLKPRQRLAVYDRNTAWLRFWLEDSEEQIAVGDETARWSTMLVRHCTALASGAREGSVQPTRCRQKGLG